MGTAHAYTTAVVRLLADRAPGLLKALREHDPEYVLLDGLSEGDRLGDGRADYSHRHRRHGVNLQGPIPKAVSVGSHRPCRARAHDLTAARAHRTIRICERQGVPIVADRAYIGVGPWVTTAIRRPAGGELSPTELTLNRALARAPVERGVALLKSWRIFRRSRCSPNSMTAIAAAALTLGRQR